MDLNLYKKLGLKRIINASGPETKLGSSSVDLKVINEMGRILPLFVDIDELQRKASEVIAWASGADAGCVTACAGAGIVESVAACMTGTNLGKIRQLPNTEGMPNEVIIQKGHAVDFGAPVTQMIRLSGAKVVEIGMVNKTESQELKHAVNQNTAAIMYVVSAEAVQNRMLPLDTCIEIAKDKNVPVIVDAAAEMDLKKYIATGADLVVYSGHKWIGAPTSGLICGRKDLTEACYLQNKGIGRAMKASKEGIYGLMIALRKWATRNHAAEQERQMQKVGYIMNRLKKLPNIEVRPCKYPTGNPIVEVEITVDSKKLGLTGDDICKAMLRGDPSIALRCYRADTGVVLIDVYYLKDDEEKLVCDKLIKILSKR